MASDFRAAMAEAIERRATEDTTSLDEARRARSARTPDMNNPWRTEPARPSRHTQRPYRDPVGEQAVGNIKRRNKP